MNVLSILHEIVVYRHFAYFQYDFLNGRQRSRGYLFIIGTKKKVLDISNIL